MLFWTDYQYPYNTPFCSRPALLDGFSPVCHRLTGDIVQVVIHTPISYGLRSGVYRCCLCDVLPVTGIFKKALNPHKLQSTRVNRVWCNVEGYTTLGCYWHILRPHEKGVSVGAVKVCDLLINYTTFKM